MKKKPKEQKSYDFGNQPKFYSLDGDLDLADGDTLPRNTSGEFIIYFLFVYLIYSFIDFCMKQHVKYTK